MATSTTASSTNTARSAGEGNELLDLRDTDAGEQESASDDNGSSTDDLAPSGHEPATKGKDGHSEALKAERRRTNHLEKELRGVRQQLTRFSEINPEEYSRLQEAERQKQLLEQQVELRERQMEEASAKKVATVAAERDGAQALVLALRKERLLERAFSEAEGRTGGDGRGTFFDVFTGQLGEAFASAPARTEVMCSNHSTARASRCWAMTGGHLAPLTSSISCASTPSTASCFNSAVPWAQGHLGWQ